jgi:hypothetical protein
MGDHFILLNSDGRLAALFVSETVESWNEVWDWVQDGWSAGSFVSIGTSGLWPRMWKRTPYQTMEARQLDCPSWRSETPIEAPEEAKTRWIVPAEEEAGHVNAWVSCLPSPWVAKMLINDNRLP